MNEDKPKKETKRKVKRISELQQTDGKLYNKHGVKSIDELLNIKSGKYQTTDPVEYENYINSLNTSDLQAHAVKIGLLPNQDRQTLLKRLTREFKINSSNLQATSVISSPFKKPLSEEALRILSDGK